MTKSKNYDENFSDAQYNPMDIDEENEYLWEFERGIVESGYED